MEVRFVKEVASQKTASIRAVLEIQTAKTTYDIFKSLKSCVRPFRLDFFAVFVKNGDNMTSLDDRIVLTNWESEVIHRCLAADFYDWPFATGLRNSVLPRSVALGDYLEQETEPGYGELAKFMRANGYEAFVHLPTRSSRGHEGAISFAGDREEVPMNEVINLNFVAQHVFERVMTILDDTGLTGNPLSTREIECLKAAGRGCNATEIAEQLDITVHTVGYHLANAQKKLGARNRTQAVAIAIQNGWLRDP